MGMCGQIEQSVGLLTKSQEKESSIYNKLAQLQAAEVGKSADDGRSEAL